MPFWRMLALLLVVSGVAAFRWDTNLSGLMIVLSYLPGGPTLSYTAYRPSWIEILSGAGIVSFGLLAFSLGVRYLKVVNHNEIGHSEIALQPKPLEKVPTPSGD